MADLKFSVWETWARTFDQMDDATVATVFRAMYRFAFDGEVPVFEPGTVAALVWPMIETSIERSVKTAKRNHENGAKHTAKPSEKPNAEPNAKPSEKPNNAAGLSDGKPEKKRKERNGNKNLEGFISNSSASDDAAAAGAAPPSAIECPTCGVDMRPTSSYKSGTRKRIWRCPLCQTEEVES